jgi:uncharacterized YigZ family protein
MTEYRVPFENIAESEFVEKRSRFIGYARPVTTEEEALEFVAAIKKRHWDAKHNVYAYVLRDGQIRRYSDDGEPQGTAGIPVLEVLTKGNITDAVIVVTRYFGGILLGAGGLTRAYAHAASIALESAQIVTYEEYEELSLVASYSEYQRYIALLQNTGAIIDDTVYDDKVTLRFAMKPAEAAAFKEKITELSGGKNCPETVGSRFDAK